MTEKVVNRSANEINPESDNMTEKVVNRSANEISEKEGNSGNDDFREVIDELKKRFIERDSGNDKLEYVIKDLRKRLRSASSH